MVAHWMDWANGNKDIPAILMTLFDVWVFKSQSFDLCPNIASWVPIDHSPCPEDVLRWCARPNVKPIAMSKFGGQMLDQAGIEHFYAPHGIEPVFKPSKTYVSSSGSATGRELMGLPDDKFVVMMNAANKGANPSRKSFAENLLAFSIFAKGEGFGLAVIEAQACGTPVIVSDFTAQPELVGSGWKVDVQPFWDAHQKAWFCTPQIPSIVDALRQAYNAPRGVDKTAVDFAQGYNADTVYEAHWKPIMKELHEWCLSSSSPS